MKRISVFLIFSFSLILIGYPTFREYLLINKGNRLSLAMEYVKGDVVFKEAINKYESIQGEVNSVINLYNGEKYKELLETTEGQGFFRGNSEVYIGEGEIDPQKQIESYEKALNEYRAAMKTSTDINIKKNYEIISKRIEEIKEQQQNQDQNQDQKNEDQDNKDQNQNNQDKAQDTSQNENNKNENDQDQNKKDQEKEEQNGDQGQDKEDQSKNQSNEDNEKDKGNQEKSKKPKDSTENQGGSTEEVEDRDTQKKEALATLERLEDSEEQAFKNNERLQYLGGDNDSEKDTW